MTIMTREEVRLIQGLDLKFQIARFYQIFDDYVSIWGVEKVYSSISGGKDSVLGTFLLRRRYPDLKAVFCDTGLEYQGVKNVIKKIDNVDVIRPEKQFVQVLTEEGYPVGSKKVAKMIRQLLHPSSRNKNSRRCYFWGIKQDGTKATSWKLAKKWKEIFRIFRKQKIYPSEKCCDEMKKKPFKKYEKSTGRKPIVFTMATESKQRMDSFLQTGCINKSKGREMCLPMATWTEQHVLEAYQLYEEEMKAMGYDLAEEYGEIVEVVNKKGEKVLKLTGETRTGCIFCMFGVHLESKRSNRFIRLKKLDLKRWRYAINGGEYKTVNGKKRWVPNKDGLGLGKILDLIQVPYDNYDFDKNGEKQTYFEDCA